MTMERAIRDFLRTEKPYTNPNEAAFRRGYYHGARAVIEALKEGVPGIALSEFLEKEIRAWWQDEYVPGFPPEIKKATDTR